MKPSEGVTISINIESLRCCIIQRETKAFELRAKHLINPRKFALAELLPARKVREVNRAIFESLPLLNTERRARFAVLSLKVLHIVIKVSGNEQVVCSLSAIWCSCSSVSECESLSVRSGFRHSSACSLARDHAPVH